MPAGGSLLQLVATGKQDVFLTGNPQISFFRMVYRRHTAFATESMPMYFDGTPNFGQRITCLIPRRGDLLGRITLDVTLPLIRDSSGTPLSYTNSVGHALIQEITFEVGEQEIDRQTGEWMEIWSQVTTPASQREALNQMIGRVEPYETVNHIPGANSEGLRLLIPLQFYFCQNPGLYLPCRLLIPLQFYFCQNPGLYLPLIALQYAPIRINITLRPLQQLFWRPPPIPFPTSGPAWQPTCSTQVDCTSQIASMLLWGEFVYLDTEERRRFVSTSHEYIIEQVQYTPPHSITAGQNTATIQVDFNHPIKEFFIVVQRDEIINRNEWFNYSHLGVDEPLPTFLQTYVNSNAPAQRLDMISSALLQLDGKDRFQARHPTYFRLEQPYQHHTTTPVNSFLYNYSFALRPEDAQPTGTMNASRIDSIVWQLEMNPLLSNPAIPSTQQRGNARVMIYAHNYNIFRVINGFGGLVFTI